MSGSSIEVNAGIQLPRNCRLFKYTQSQRAHNLLVATAIPPRFSVRNGGLHPGSSFVIAMIDLDAPTPQAPTLSQIRHFLGGNFHPTPGGRGTQDLVNSTVALSDFLQPTPPAGSDPHRYSTCSGIPIPQYLMLLIDMFSSCSINQKDLINKHWSMLPHQSQTST